MRKKLFSMESEDVDLEDRSNDLLIDKVLKRAEQPKSAMSLTADLLKQRQNLKKEITDELSKDEEDEEDSDDSSSEEDSDSDDSSPEEDSEDTSGEEDAKDKNDDDTDENDSSRDDEEDSSESDGSETESDAGKDDDEEDSGSAADDSHSLAKHIGSGLGDGDKKKHATESLFINKPVKMPKAYIADKVTFENVFEPIKKVRRNYLSTLKTYSLEAMAVDVADQPVAYVKESVNKSLNGLVLLASKYIDNNKQYVSTVSKSIKDINERITVFKEFVEAKKYSFTDQLLTDKDILSKMGIPGKSDIRSTSRTLMAYLDNTIKATAVMVNNPFEALSDAFGTAGFKSQDGDYIYQSTLPGFSSVRLHIENYNDYLNTNIENFHFYKINVLKTEDLFELEGITVSDDKELLYITSILDKLLVDISTSVDNLNDINTHFSKFIDEIKVIIYDVEKGTKRNFSELGIDEKLKDFIKFKIAMESYFISIKLAVEYLTGVMSVINICVKLDE